MKVGGPVLAIYDFRSKQEFIYRTNRMREITGGSELIAGTYDRFLGRKSGAGSGSTREINGKGFIDDWKDDIPTKLFDEEGMPDMSKLAGKAGAVVYEGGGNLLVLYADEDAYLAANRVFSRMAIDEAYSLGMIAAHVTWEPSTSSVISHFEHNRRRVYRALDCYKRIGDSSVPCNTLPYTKVDRTTFQPIVGTRKFWSLDGKKRVGEQEISRESKAKLDAYDCLPLDRKREGQNIDDLGLEHGKDSLIAVIYFDGNSIGERLLTAVNEGVEAGKTPLEAMRAFSRDLHATLVENTEEAMKKAIDSLPDKYRGYRVIIDHGDEITLICNAHAAPFALDAYFDAIDDTGYNACGGMAFCHSHDPFAEVYKIAEACCESGKDMNRAEQSRGGADSSYVDFHFCRSGITGTLDQIREAQEGPFTGRPYVVGASYRTFIDVGHRLAHSKLQRADIKALNRCILESESSYELEWERLKAKDCGAISEIEGMFLDEGMRKKVVFDVVSMWDVFDLRFSGLEEGEVVI